MSITETYQVTSNINSEYIATPQREVFDTELMYFVSRLVFDAAKKKNGESLTQNDLNSVAIILEAEKKAAESLGRSLI